MPLVILGPHEYQCPFRANLKKRTNVDGFAREDIFYIAPDGRTMGAVMAEVLFLLESEVPPWFFAFSDLGAVVRALSGADAGLKGTGGLGLGTSGATGSYNTTDLLATLQLERHVQKPEEVSATTAIEAIDATVGVMLNTFFAGPTAPSKIESDSRRMRDLLLRARASLVLGENICRSHPAQCELLGDLWNFDHSTAGRTVESKLLPSTRDSLWPMLRDLGFVEFTDRLAHRPNADSIEVVSLVPMHPVEKSANNYPGRLFRICLGVFWPKLAEREGTRKNTRGHFRPKLEECFLQTWLMPADRATAGGPTCFDRVSEALSALRKDAETWFSLWRDRPKGNRLLAQPDWVILACYPTMRGYGSANSVTRALLSAILEDGSPEELAAGLSKAHKAVDRHPDHLKPRYQGWVDRVEARWQQ